MSSGFVSGGTIDNPTERDDEWRKAQEEIAQKRLEREQQSTQDGGKSLYEVLQDNKAKKQDAFEEATRLKNQYRALDDEEADFLESVLEATRKQEEAVKKDTLEQLDLFRKQQEEAERKALEEQVIEGPKEDEAQWIASGRKRKKGPESGLLKGVKLRKASSTEGESARTKNTTNDEVIQTSSGGVEKPTLKSAALPLSKPSIPLSLSLGYASSDDDD